MTRAIHTLSASLFAALTAVATALAAENSAFDHYDVPPMSGVQRLPDAKPVDGTLGGTVRIIMARDEYEPGSFVICPRRDLGKVQLSLSEFRSDDGRTLPPDALDLKVVKVWYQNGNGWFSYFGDTGFKLCPELLLNDEELIRVDTNKMANYARLTEPDGTVREQWINPPRQLDRIAAWNFYRGGNSFASMKPNFADADSIRPVSLGKGVYKQFFLTVRTTKETAPGLYRGEVRVGSFGTIPVAVRVLDFTLPEPGCYDDIERPFYVNFYTHDRFDNYLELNGGDLDLAKRQFLAVMRNRVAHGQNIHWLEQVLEASCRDMLPLMKEAGIRDDVCVGLVPIANGRPQVELESLARRSMAAVSSAVGHGNIYAVYGDENHESTLRDMRPMLKAFQGAGFKFILANTERLFRKNVCNYADGWINVNRPAEDDLNPRIWNQLPDGARVAWYSAQHVGIENPEFNRRQNGLAAWLSGYTALCNYAHYNHPYNDDSTTYRPMVFTYVQYSGCIDTLQWEGFREGIDDIRYATELVGLARKAAKSPDVETRHAGSLAMQLLVAFRKDGDDLYTCRREMIRHILKLRGLLNAKG